MSPLHRSTPLRRAPVLVDTSAMAALANRHDDNHHHAREIWQRLRREKCRPFTTNVLVIETHALLLIRSHHTVARSWLSAQPFPEHWITEQDYANARQLIVEYDDRDFSLADATSFVVMERLRTPWAFTFDEHFAQYGFSPLTA